MCTCQSCFKMLEPRFTSFWMPRNPFPFWPLLRWSSSEAYKLGEQGCTHYRVFGTVLGINAWLKYARIMLKLGKHYFLFRGYYTTVTRVGVWCYPREQNKICTIQIIAIHNTKWEKNITQIYRHSNNKQGTKLTIKQHVIRSHTWKQYGLIGRRI